MEEEARAIFLRQIGERIRSRRIDLRMQQQELAEAVGFRQKNVALYEQGKVDIPISRLHDFARALDTSISALLGETEDRPSPQIQGVTHMLADMPGATNITLWLDAAVPTKCERVIPKQVRIRKRAGEGK